MRISILRVNWNNILCWLGCAITVSLVIGFYLYVDHSIGWTQLIEVNTLRGHFAKYGVWGPVFYIALLTVAVVISQVPNIPLTITAGIVFGPVLGGIYSLIGGLIGASIDFWIGRLLGRIAVKKLLGKTLTFCDRCTNAYIGKIILSTRLIPIFSFDIISYAAGLTGISFKAFFKVTAIGMLPMTFALTSAGDVIHISPAIMIGLTSFVIVGIFIIPVLIHRYNWLDLRNRIKIE